MYEIILKSGRFRQGTNDNVTRRKRFACWLDKARYTKSEYVKLIAFTPIMGQN
jgi:hypothetical protein